MNRLLVFLLFFVTPLLADECWIYTPPGYQSIGGSGRIGPYSDYYQALSVNNEYFDGYGTIDCVRTEEDHPAPRFAYGAAKFHNRTSRTLTFKVRTAPNAGWDQVTVKPGYWHWFWRECPCRFHVSWPGGRQEVTWYGYSYQPSDSQAYDWQFVERGASVVLIEGSEEPIPRPPAVADVSFVGEGDGTANRKWGEATHAEGWFKLTFMPRIHGVIPTLEAQWEMHRESVVSDPDATTQVETWRISADGLLGPYGEFQTMQIQVTGGAGSGEFWATEVPGLEGQGSVKIRVHVQFSGRNVRLSFTKSY